MDMYCIKCKKKLPEAKYYNGLLGYDVYITKCNDCNILYSCGYNNITVEFE